MAQQWTCPCGHRWEVQPSASLPAQCPACGTPVAGNLAEASTLGVAPAEPVTEGFATPGTVNGTAQVPGYEILAELGRGGMGVVYKARQLALDRIVALKMILSGSHAGSQDLARFHLEARAVAQLSHPHIVQIYDVGAAEGRAYLALEFIDGRTLAQQTPLPPEEAARIVALVARAMHTAHENGIVHRDLKPANILLTANGTPKITDFGLAKKMGDVRQTASGAILGTPSYMPPEQAGGSPQDLGPASDIYSLGAILYELLTGQPPFVADTPLNTVLRAASEEPTPPRRLQPAVPGNLETICLKCLEKQPKRRYATARELAEDLERALADEPILPRPPGPVGRLLRWASRQPAFATTLIGLSLFYLTHLLCLTVFQVGGEGGFFHWFVTGLMLVWAGGAAFFQRLSQRGRWHEVAIYAWASWDVLLFTLVLSQANGPSSPLIGAYLLLIGGAGLRFRIPLVWFVTGTSLAGYLALTAQAHLMQPEKAVPAYHTFIVSVILVMMGLILYLLLRRLRAISST
jgi:serine/threonine-protein kinase